MEYEVKPFGRYGLHITLRKRDGFREGMKVKVHPNGHELQSNTMQNKSEDSLLQRNAKSNTSDYDAIREKLLQDEEFLMRLLARLEEVGRKW